MQHPDDAPGRPACPPARLAVHLAVAGALLLLLTLIGSAGAFLFEQSEPASPLNSFGEALW